MKHLKRILLAAAMLSVLSACQESDNDILSGGVKDNSDYLFDENGGYTDENGGYTDENGDYHLPKRDPDEVISPSTIGEAYSDQDAKYGDMLPLEYEDWMTGGIYGIMTDIDSLIIHYCDYYTTDGEQTYVDNNGERHITYSYLRTDDAEIAFEDGAPASDDDLTPGTAVLVQYETVLETWPGQMVCTKIIILQ